MQLTRKSARTVRQGMTACWREMASKFVPGELAWLYKQTRGFLRWHFLSVICLTIGSALGLLTPLVMKWLIDTILPRREFSMLLAAVALIFLSYEGRILLTSLGGYLTFHASQLIAFDLRMRMLKHLSGLSADYHENTPIGAKLYLLNQPIDQIADSGADLFPSILQTLLSTIFVVGTMFFLSARLTCLVLPVVPVFLLVRHHFRMELEGACDDVQNEQSNQSGFLQEHIAAALQIQLLRQEKKQARRAFHRFAELYRAQHKLWRVAFGFTTLSELIIVVGIVAILGFGGASVLKGGLTIGGLVAFYTYLAELFQPLSTAVEMYSRAHRVFADVRRLRDAFEILPSVRESATAIDFPRRVKGTIQVRDVSFSYGAEGSLLRIPELSVGSGERVAIVGSNGAGKSTLAKLLARVYDPFSGSVWIDGFDIREIKLRALRDAVTYVPASPILFDATVRDNLLYGNPAASKFELQQVAHATEMEKLIRTLPRGWDEPLGPGGIRLSSGERQRIVIARALLQKPPILILDEATSSLDGPSEQLILEKLSGFLSHSTLLFISHRVSTVCWVDRILVLEKGILVEEGNHRDLYGQNSVYCQLFKESSSWKANSHTVS